MTAQNTHTVALGPDSGLDQVFQLAQQLRVDSVRASTAAGSGHPTSSLSAADLMAVLMTRQLRYDWQNPKNPANDHLIFSKGHASPLLYAMFLAAGAIGEEELMTTYRRNGARLQGHPTPVLPWVDAATGSLGQGIAYGVGIALAGRDLEHLPYRVWVLCGDSEMTEGSVWEALDKAGRHRLANFVAIIDVNRLGQRGPTELGWDTGAYARRAEAFGCRALVVDGHDLADVEQALAVAGDGQAPTVVVARTVKGQGVPEVADAEGWHGKALPEDLAARAVTELGGVRHLTVRGHRPAAAPSAPSAAPAAPVQVTLPQFRIGESVATRVAFGKALAAIGARPDIVALDAEVGNSTHAEDFGKAHPERYFQTYIAEQQMIASAVGMAVRGYRPYATTFAAFLTRAHDFIRMAAVSQISMSLCGTHCGVEIGADGPSQMGLEDLAMMRAVHGSTVLYPSDATSAAALTAAMAYLDGISYLRTTRGAYPVLYGSDETFPVGGSKTLRASDRDRVTLIGAGVTVHECLAAADQLAADGIPARVVDLYSVKPLDLDMLAHAARETGALVVVEDHHPEGGIGEAVLSALAAQRLAPGLAHLAVRNLPGSGTTSELLDAAGISRTHIIRTAHDLVGR
ncbi:MULTISPECIES: transketolase [unclassified Streptomyces]|uniref:transketolase n=1 Tax=unclassified Streptomyces TaxID=2593676 RepID=UPI0022598F3B|nr:MULTISPECIES: transketolase [unclassified Streptomyces]WSP53725.1 transketolase [Streptomyces sp. NBC_01241]WSU25606.1 transketolase [Streptomyces sp. NBC_01108]MCX4785126.1 transketolase [Streptomyces sp. NBC_01221]MCX4798933.1 transketolase [Streptomyces sp. NBC_01242]WSJ40131.1 transketolase [Streptomyces sp. NBC_01321]